MKLLFTKNKLGVENRTLRLGDLHYWLVVEHKNRVKDHHIECSHWLPLKPFCIPNGNPKFTFKIVFTQFFSRICCWMYLPYKNGLLDESHGIQNGQIVSYCVFLTLHKSIHR